MVKAVATCQLESVSCEEKFTRQVENSQIYYYSTQFTLFAANGKQVK